MLLFCCFVVFSCGLKLLLLCVFRVVVFRCDVVLLCVVVLACCVVGVVYVLRCFVSFLLWCVCVVGF